jgi:hypothetical protein
MGEPEAAKAKTKKIAARPIRRNAFDWYELKLEAAGATGAAGSALHAERIFFLPDMDASLRIEEGPAPADWTGYHAGKHGVYERFTNLKGESLNMGELFFKEKYRWVRSEYLKSPSELKTLSESQFQSLLDQAYKDAPRQTQDLSGIFDSEKFTADVKTLFDKYRFNTKSTVWQARYIYKDWKTGAVKGYGELQTNVDFEFEGSHYRVAVDAKTGKALNFFRIDPNPKFGPMKFSEIVLRWKGKVTDVTVHKVEGSTITIEVSATWPRLFVQGVKSGAAAGAVISAFFGAIDGFKKEGLVGALKGLAIGAMLGGAVGGAIGGVVTLAARIWPWVGRVAKIGGFIVTVVAILLDASETALDPQEFGRPTKDDDGNKWYYRNVHKTGSIWSPEYIPRGLLISCPDGTVLQFGEDESGYESSYDRTPITVYAGSKRLKWHSIRMADGSSMWWWQDQATKEEFAVTYQSDSVMKTELARVTDESAYRFTPTQN